MSTPEFHVPSSPELYDAALEGLVRLDQEIIRKGVVPLWVYDSGAVYKKEPRDVWRHALDISRQKWGDCEDLAAYLAAGYRESGQDPDAHVYSYKTGPRTYHAIVQRGNGTFEDPSRELGMRPASKGGNETVSYDQLYEVPHAKRIIEGDKNMDGPNAIIGEDPTPEYKQISFDLVRGASGWSGVVRIPAQDGQALFLKTSTSSSPAVAAKKTVNITKLAASHPMVQAAMPPQARLAASVLQRAPTGRAANLLAKRFGH